MLNLKKTKQNSKMISDYLVKIHLRLINFFISLFLLSFLTLSCSNEKNEHLCSFKNDAYTISIEQAFITSAAAFGPQYIQIKIASSKEEEHFISDKFEIKNDGANLYCDTNFKLEWISKNQFYLSMIGEEQSLKKVLFEIKTPLSKSVYTKMP